MNRKAIILLCFLMLGCVGCQAHDPSMNTTSQVQAQTIALSTPEPTDTAQPTPIDTPTTQPALATPQPTQPNPATQPTQPPAVQPTSPATTGTHGCDTSSCSNPWGYVIGLKGSEQGEYIYTAPTGFCGWFSCIANFPNGRGYIVECLDGKMSKSGGISGSCSDHQGQWDALYILTSGGGGPTPTPQPTAKPSPSPTVNPTAVWTPQPTPVPPSPVPTA